MRNKDIHCFITPDSIFSMKSDILTYIFFKFTMSSAFTDNDLSDDSRSFIETQKGIKKLHQKFSSALDEIKEFGMKDDDLNQSLEEDDDQDFASTPIVTQEQDIRLLIRDIQQIQVDVNTVRNLIQSRPGKDKVRVARITRQLDDILQVLEGQLFRAERLL